MKREKDVCLRPDHTHTQFTDRYSLKALPKVRLTLHKELDLKAFDLSAITPHHIHTLTVAIAMETLQRHHRGSI